MTYDSPLVYSKTYTSFTREELCKLVSQQMSDKRFKHVLGVEKAAVKLAELYQSSPEQASIAALCHDYAKERSDKEMVSLIREHSFDKELLDYSNLIWHGILGAYLVSKELDIHNEEILQAIRLHTTGAKEMSLLDKIIYVADYIEEGRQFPVVEEARRLAWHDLDEAVAFETSQTLWYLIKRKEKIFPKTLETYNEWVAKRNKLEILNEKK